MRLSIALVIIPFDFFPIHHFRYGQDNINNILNYNAKIEWLHDEIKGRSEIIPISRRESPITPKSTQEGLMEFYDMMNGNDWFENTNWGGPDPCTYYGIICNNGEVTEIFLDSNNLHGQFNDSIQWTSGLANLEVLSFPFSHISGTIPCQLGKLAQLYYINIQQSFFSGIKIDNAATS